MSKVQNVTYGTMQPSPSSQAPPRRRQESGATTSSNWRDQDGYFDLDDNLDAAETISLIQISYNQLIRNYTLVPISSLVSFAFFVALLGFCWPYRPSPEQRQHTYAPYWRELFVGVAAWIVSYTLRLPIYLLATFFTRYTNALTVTLSTVTQVTVEEAIRLAALIFLSIHIEHPKPNPHEYGFHQVWWFALGWALVEVVYGIAQGYDQLSLYKDVLDENWLEDEEDVEEQSDGRRYVSNVLKATSPPVNDSPRQHHQSEYTDASTLLEDEMAQLIAIKHRAELEQLYGVPPPNIPVFVICLQRLDSYILTLGLTLTISSRYLSTTPPSLLSTLPSFIGVVAIHASLALMWNLFLAKIGVPSASYGSLLVGLGLFFVGLASWGALA